MFTNVPPDPKGPSPEILADAIVRISKALEDLSRNSRLNQDAIVALVHDSTKMSKRDIYQVLEGLADLRKKYVIADKKKS